MIEERKNENGDKITTAITENSISSELPVLHDDVVTISDSHKRKLDDGSEDKDADGSTDDRHRKRKKKSKDRDREKDKDRKHKDKDRDRDRKKDRSTERDRDRKVSPYTAGNTKETISVSESIGKDERATSIEKGSADVEKKDTKTETSKDESRSNNGRGAPRDDQERDRDRERDSRNRRSNSRSRRSNSYRRPTMASSGYGGYRGRSDSRDRPPASHYRDATRPTDRYSGRADSRDRDSRRDNSRDRARERERDRERRDRERERDRDRGDRDRRDRDRDRGDRDRGRDRSSDRRREQRTSDEKDRETASGGDNNKNSILGYKPITLKEVLAANPGISVPEAVIRLNAFNSALARGEIPLPITGQFTPATSNPMTNLLLPNGFLGGLQASGAAVAGGATGAGGGGLADNGGILTKPHRELYIGNLPPGITVPQLAEFLNTAMKQLQVANNIPNPTQQNSVITAWVSPDGHYGFVELRSIEEANLALNSLNGIPVGNNYAIKVGRPKGYIATGGATMASGLPGGGVGSVVVPMQGVALPMNASMIHGLGANNPLLAGLNLGGGVGGMMSGGEPLSKAIMVTNISMLLTETQLKELFVPFGEIQAFNLIKTPTGTTQSAVFEYASGSDDLLDMVVQGMNNIDIAGLKLSVSRLPKSLAATLLKPATTATVAVTASPKASSVPTAIASQPQQPPSAVVRLSNMVTEQDLADDELYQEIIEDVADEGNQHTTIRQVIIPRKMKEEDSNCASQGMVFMHCLDETGAAKVIKAVHGRRYAGKIVEATYYPEELFMKKIYVLPKDYDPTKSIMAVSSSNLVADNDLD